MSSIVLIHGAYQGGWIWRPTARVLRAMGHEVLTPTLDGCAQRSHQLRAGISNETHAQEVAELLRYEDLHDVVLVGTSSGGMVLARVAELARERIARLVFADALALLDGERISDFVNRRNAVTTQFGTGPSREDARDRLFADLDESTRDWALDRFTPHPVEVMTGPVHLTGFWQQNWKARVIWCRNSVNPPREHQQRATDLLKADWHELNCGHYPMLERPDALAELIAAA